MRQSSIFSANLYGPAAGEAIDDDTPIPLNLNRSQTRSCRTGRIVIRNEEEEQST